MSPRRKTVLDEAPIDEAPIDEARIVRDLETIRDGAMEAGAWAPALRAVELLGRHIGLWRSEGPPQTSLAELINAAADKAPPDVK